MEKKIMNEQELLKNFKDVNWRLNNLYYIKSDDGSRVKFIPNQAQVDFLSKMTGRDLILKARQLGFTTLICIISLDEALFNSNQSCLIIAHNIDSAKKIFDNKIKYGYDNLPDFIKAKRSALRDRVGSLKFNNDSRIDVSNSARSDTLTRLHISEFGKICAKDKYKAKEIVTGSLPAAHRGNITIESTAEGQDGYFYDYCQKAEVGKGSFKFHFFPWFRKDTNISYDTQTLNNLHSEYFGKLEYDLKINLSDEQKNWWIIQEDLLGGDMKRENPSTPKEAFESAIEGCYFSTAFKHLYLHKKIGMFKADPYFPVYTFWDLGYNDMTAIWFMQCINKRYRFINYYENSGEHISHYVYYVKQYCKDNELDIGNMYLPHDASRQDQFIEGGRESVFRKLGIAPIVVKKPHIKYDAIVSARHKLPDCDFDEAGCSVGLQRLKFYRKDWDSKREVYRDQPRHDVNSHGADAFMTFSSGFNKPNLKIILPPRKEQFA